MRSESTKPSFRGGGNIALKVPPHQYEATVRFYRDVLRLKSLLNHPPEVGFEFGSCQLWIDRVPAMSQAEVWLEIKTEDVPSAAEHLASAGVVRCDDIEALPAGFDGFWISNPASVIHIVSKPEY